MCLEHQAVMMNARESFSAAVNKCNIGGTIRKVLYEAQTEGRLTVGLEPAIARLSAACEGALFCLLAPPRPGDSAQHMLQVLLEAFCLGNDIYIINVDSAEKLHNMLPGYNARDCGCVLVHQPYSDPYSDDSPQPSLEDLSQPDKTLAQHCEHTWGLLPPPIVRLPEQ